jgi:hypothetical protein
MPDKKESWEFSVVGCDSHDNPRFLAFSHTYEDAQAQQQSLTTVGWRRVAIFDAYLKEVKEKPKT